MNAGTKRTPQQIRTGTYVILAVSVATIGTEAICGRALPFSHNIVLGTFIAMLPIVKALQLVTNVSDHDVLRRDGVLLAILGAVWVVVIHALSAALFDGFPIYMRICAVVAAVIIALGLERIARST